MLQGAGHLEEFAWIDLSQRHFGGESFDISTGANVLLERLQQLLIF